MFDSNEAKANLILVQEATGADIHGIKALIHAAGLPPIELRGPISMSGCGLIASFQGHASGAEVDSTWLIPVSKIHGVEIQGDWVPSYGMCAENPAETDRQAPTA